MDRLDSYPSSHESCLNAQEIGSDALKKGSNLVLIVCVLLLGSSMLQPEDGTGNPAANLFAAIDNASMETIATLKHIPK